VCNKNCADSAFLYLDRLLTYYLLILNCILERNPSSDADKSNKKTPPSTENENQTRLSNPFRISQSPMKNIDDERKERVSDKDDNVNCFRDMTLSSSSKSSDDALSSKDFSDSSSATNRLKDYPAASKLTSPIPLHPNFSAISAYPNSFLPHLTGSYPMLHPSQLSALSAIMSGNANPYSYLGSAAMNPALLQAVANAGGVPNVSRVHPSTSGANSAFAGAMGRGNYNSLFSNPQSLSAFNAYAHFLPYGAMAAAGGYSSDTSTLPSATGSMDLPGRSLSPMSFANRLYRHSVFSKPTSNVSSTPSIPSLSANGSLTTNPLLGGAFANGAKTRYAPYSLPPQFGFNFKSHMAAFHPTDELRYSAFSRQRKPSGSTSPSSTSTPPPAPRVRTGSISSDSHKSMTTTRQSVSSPQTPTVSNAVQELRNIENMVSGLDHQRHNKVNPV